MTKIIIEDHLISGIPVLSIYQENLHYYPLIVYIHGYGGDREQALDFGYMLAKKGFYFISLDCKDHGLRQTKISNKKFPKVFPEDTGLDTYVHMHEVIEQTGNDVQTLIEYFKSKDEIDSNIIGLTGFSMGGYATFYIAANNPDIKVAVPIAGKPTFTRSWEDGILSTSTYNQWSKHLQDSEHEIAKRTEYFRSIDPFEKMSSFAPKPILIINGDQDTDSLFIYSLELYKKLLPLYAKKQENLELWMPFVDHQFTHSMKVKVCHWFEQHLTKEE